MNKTCYLHIGTHKTGTTYFQNLLAMNPQFLQEKGILYPMSGRDHVEGHNNIAWELLGHKLFKNESGTVESLAEEISSSNANIVVVSSEELEMAYSKREILYQLKSFLEQSGCTVYVVVFFREWVSYTSSIYAQILKNNPLELDFKDFMKEILTTGQFSVDGWGPVCFDYEKIVLGFSEVFGRDRMVCRAYSDRTDEELLSILGLDSKNFSVKPLKKRNQSFGTVLSRVILDFNRIAQRMSFDDAKREEGVYAIAARVQKASLSGKKFSAVTPSQAKEMEKRFKNTRLWLEENYRISLPACPSNFGFWQEFRTRVSMMRHYFELKRIVDEVVRELSDSVSRGKNEGNHGESPVFSENSLFPSGKEQEPADKVLM